MRTKYVFGRKDVRGADAPLASATKDGVVLRSDLDQAVWNPSEDVSNFKLVEPDDFVVGLRSFQHGISHSDVRGLVSPAYTVLRAETTVDPRFYKYYFRSLLLISRLDNLSQGIRQGRTIDIEAFLDLDLPVPPLDEQRRIADFLDAETARIDELTRLRELQRSVIGEREFSAISEIVTPGISDDRAPRSTRWPWLPAHARESPLVRLGYLARLQTGLTVDGSRVASHDHVIRPYLRVANVQSGGLSLDTVTEILVPRSVAARCTLRAGDVLMTEGGDLDKLGRGTVWQAELPECLHQNHVFAIRPDARKLYGEYLALLTRSYHGRRYFESTGVRTTNLASTNSSKILDFPCPLPPIDMQRRFVQRAGLVSAKASRARNLLEGQLRLLAERRQALITAAVTGQIDVTTARGADV